MSQQELSDFERTAETRARHRALIMQVLHSHSEGLTTQQVLMKVIESYGYSFLVDNRLRELRAIGWVRSEGKPIRWIAQGETTK
jgi:cytochrome c-type biogenesis protein CcmH/NrfF